MQTASTKDERKEQRKDQRSSRSRGFAFLTALAGFLIVNFITGAILGAPVLSLTSENFKQDNYQDPMFGTWTWWMARGWVMHKETPEIALLGSSQINAPSWAADATLLQRGVDCLLHRNVETLSRDLEKQKSLPPNLTVANCAVQGGVASDYYIISRALFEGERCPELVVLGISPRDFIDNKLPSASSTEVFRFFSRFASADKLASLAYPDLKDRSFAWLDWKIRSTPLRRLNEIITAKVDTWAESANARPLRGKKRRAENNELMAAIYNAHQQVKPGEWVVPPNMQPTFVDNTQEYVARYTNCRPKSLPIQYAFFRELLTMLKEKKVNVLVVALPTLPMNRKLLPDGFWKDHNEAIRTMCADSGAKFSDLSASTDFVQADYVDTVHLNNIGGAKLFAKIAETIGQDKKLASALNSSRIAAK